MNSPNEIFREHIPHGWRPIFDDLLLKLQKLDPTSRILDAKQKFGELRVYLKSYAPGASGLVDAATRQSKHVCEECGGPAVLRVSNGYYQALCQEHAGESVVVERSPIAARIRIMHGRAEFIDPYDEE